MKNLKKAPTKQLEKFSNIFTQLGLVLVLFIVYLTIEYKTEQKQLAISSPEFTKIVFIEPEQNVVFTKEKKIPRPKPTICFVDIVKKGEEDFDEEIFIDDLIDDDQNQIDIDNLDEVVEPPTIIEDVPYDFVQNTPVFKGCEGLSEVENKKCFVKKMERFVKRNFDADLANELGLSSGKKKIFTQFIIDNHGKVVDVKVRAPHKQLEKEAKDLINKLPKFTPGKQGSQSVKVKYSLPIVFRVE